MSIPTNLRGMLAMLTAMAVFIASDSCTKLALADAPLFELTFMRGLASVALFVPLLFLLGYGNHIHRALNPWLIARGLCEVVANFGFTFAIYHMAIADVTAITQTCPLFILLGAWLLWGEKLGLARLALIGLGICGALMVAQPGASAASPYAILGFAVAIAAAGRDLITRKVPQAIPAPVVAFAVITILGIAGGAGMLTFETPIVPTLRDVALMVAAGAMMSLGHICVFMAYKIGPARSVAPFMYSLTLWAVLAGVLLFNDYPNALAIAGMALVTAAGLLVIYLDGRRRVIQAA